MKLRVPLPKCERGTECKAHPYPFQIGIQTMEFIQSSVFYFSLLDTMAGEYLNQEDPWEKLKSIMIQTGCDEGSWEQSFNNLIGKEQVFKQAVFQNVLIYIRSHWDWYIRNLSEFVLFARDYLSDSKLSKKEENTLRSIGHKDILKQISIIETASDVFLNLTDEEQNKLFEMSLVRNLGLHSRWEVDTYYLEKTSTNGWSVGDIRVFTSIELGSWHELLLRIIREFSMEISKKFSEVPEFLACRPSDNTDFPTLGG